MERVITIRGRKDQRSNDDLLQQTPADLIGMVWPLTEAAWAFKAAAERDQTESPDAQPRLPRHIVRVRKRGR
jgi:hypothetical protein